MELLKDKTKRKQIICIYNVFLINGMLALSIGSLLPYIRDSRGLEYDFCGLIVSIHSVGNLISSFFAGTFAVMFGRRKSILMFNVFFAIAYILIVAGESNMFLLLAFLLTGLARGATSNFCNASINGIATGNVGVLNGLHAMFSVGAFMFPILLTVITGAGADKWVTAVFFMIAMGVLSWILYAIMPVDEGIVKKKEGDQGTFEFLKEPMFGLCTATLFFYLCAEQGVIGWMITYFKDTGLISEGLAQITASVLWIMILAGRLSTAWLSTRVRKSNLLRIMGIGLVLFFVMLIMGIKKYPMAWSFMLTIASSGSIIMPSIIGKIAGSAGIFYGMSSIVIVVIIDMVLIFSLTSYMKRNNLD